MPKSLERFEEMRIKGKQNLMEAALKLFSANGYHSTSTRAIAKEAGVALGLMYNYFGSKEELLVNIIDEYFKEMILSIFQEVSDNQETWDVRKIVDAIINVIREKREAWRLLISIMFQPDIANKCIIQIEGFLLHKQELFEQYFQRKGVDRPTESAKVLAAILHGAFLHYAASGNFDELLLLRETVIENIIEHGV
jgi:AcrR family transcriptional regulator